MCVMEHEGLAVDVGEKHLNGLDLFRSMLLFLMCPPGLGSSECPYQPKTCLQGKVGLVR